MLHLLYPKVISTKLQIAEKANPYTFFTERHMQAIWLEQKYFTPLKTVEGHQIKVLSPGIWNSDAGPDFLKAHLKIGNIEVRGDIELHLSDESWTSHRHHCDNRYDQVILHIGFWPRKSDKNIVTSKGKHIPRVHLENFLTISEARIVKLIDLDLYPYKKFLGSGKCAKAVFGGLKENEISLFFRDAALWRLIKKGERLKVSASKPWMAFPLGLAAALGYKNNAQTFMTLFSLMEDKTEWDEWTLLTFCMGSCGFFGEKHLEKWFQSEFYQSLYQRYLTLPSHLSKNLEIKLNQVRPYNHPVRRLAYLVKIVKDKRIPHLYESLLNLWKCSWNKNIPSKELTLKFYSLLPEYLDNYWNRFFIFENIPKKDFLPLIGQDLKMQILVNAFFPLLFSDLYEGKNTDEIIAFINFYSTFPSSSSGKLQYLSHRFFGERFSKNMFNRAETQQGAFQLHSDFCTHYEASCEGCPFIENFHSVFS